MAEYSQQMAVSSFLKRSKYVDEVIEGTFSRILFSQTNNCAPRTISFLLFHSFFIVHRSVLTAGNLIKVKAQRSFKKFHL